MTWLYKTMRFSFLTQLSRTKYNQELNKIFADFHPAINDHIIR